MFPLLLAYLLLGPAFWLFMGFGLLSARSRLGKLRRVNPSLPENSPAVSVMIPARNEGPGIARCLESVLAMDYPDFRVIAVDDRSTDDTLVEMKRVAAGNARLSVLEITGLPERWMGKCHALHVAANMEAASANRAAGAPWLLFIDSDVTVMPDALRSVMAMALARGADAVSLLTRQRCETFLERLCTPLACGAVVTMYAGSLTNDDNKKETAFANGQFFMIRREAYNDVGGHEAVRFLATEDVDLMRLLKKAEWKTRLYNGDHLAETRMYDSIQRMYKGWARIYSTASHRRPWRILIASLFVLSGMAAFVTPALFWQAGPLWRGAALLHLAAVLSVIGPIYRWSGNRFRLAFLFPAAGAVQLSFFAYALWWCVTKKVEWRGTMYTSAGPAGQPHSVEVPSR